MRTPLRPRPRQGHLRFRPRPEALEGRALLSGTGTLDASFGGGAGHVSSSVGLRYYSGSVQSITFPPPANLPQVPTIDVKSLVAEADGKVVAAGTLASGADARSFSLVITRTNADGSPDTFFGPGGQVQVPIGTTTSFNPFFPTTYTPYAVATAVQGDGKVIVATEGTDGGGNPTYVVARLNLDGSVDTGYGVGGIAEYPASTTTPAVDRIDTVDAAVIQADGKLVLVGTVGNASTTRRFAAARLDAGGSLDPTYGTAGTVVVPVTVAGLIQDQVAGVARLGDGRIVVAGMAAYQYRDTSGSLQSGYQPVVIRLGSNGALDTSYGGASAAGVVLLPVNPGNPTAVARGVAIQPADGKVIVSGADGTGAPAGGDLLYRLDVDGTRDAGFGLQGIVLAALSGPVAVQADGKILVGSSSSDALARFNPDGTKDRGFGNPSSHGSLALRPRVPSIGALAIQPADGKILVAAQGNAPSPSGRVAGLGVFRVLAAADASPAALPPPIAQPADFDGSGQTNAAIFDPAPAPFLPSNGSFVIQTVVDRTDPRTPVTAQAFGFSGLGQSIPAVADYLGVGGDQLADYRPATGTYEIRGSTFTTLQFGTPGTGQTIPAPADYEGTGQADVAVYLTASGSFAILPSDGSAGRIVPFGTAGLGQSIPAPADYYGTGQADVAVYLAQAGAFAVLAPDGQSGVVVPFGKPGLGQSIPVPGDYDGSGHTEIAVFVPSLGAFFYRPYGGGADGIVPFGTPGVGELPVVGDYDGSGRTEFAVYDPSRGFIAYRPAFGGADVITDLGPANAGAIPVAAPAGALPEFAASGSGGGGSVRKSSVATPGTSASPPSASAVSVGSARPVGPKFAPSRVARAPVNQGIAVRPTLGG